jgi:UDP-N-acetylglucosamine 4,6-dehydratase/5-epimerase
MLDNKTILVTGGTGSFGSRFVESTLKNAQPKKIIIFSRDEMKQWAMSKIYENESRVRFFIGDVRDKDRLKRALDGVDIVIHAAANKIVHVAEYNPFEAIKTNIVGAMNVVDSCLDSNVKRVVALSTDKASSPVNLYGATKLVSDKLFVSANAYSGSVGTKFSVVRYGNVMGSRGSVIPFFLQAKETGVLPITDPKMTRFMIRLSEGIGLVNHALKDMRGGEIYVKKIPSMNIMDIAKAVAPDCKTEVIGVRAGEKLHEQMISSEEAEFTYEFDGYFKILPFLVARKQKSKTFQGGVKVEPGFSYRSDTNTEILSSDDLKKWIKLNYKALVA